MRRATVGPHPPNQHRSARRADLPRAVSRGPKPRTPHAAATSRQSPAPCRNCHNSLRGSEHSGARLTPRGKCTQHMNALMYEHQKNRLALAVQRNRGEAWRLRSECPNSLARAEIWINGSVARGGPSATDPSLSSRSSLSRCALLEAAAAPPLAGCTSGGVGPTSPSVPAEFNNGGTCASWKGSRARVDLSTCAMRRFATAKEWPGTCCYGMSAGRGG